VDGPGDEKGNYEKEMVIHQSDPEFQRSWEGEQGRLCVLNKEG
jgi:hypothetical protein